MESQAVGKLQDFPITILHQLRYIALYFGDSFNSKIWTFELVQHKANVCICTEVSELKISEDAKWQQHDQNCLQMREETMGFKKGKQLSDYLLIFSTHPLQVFGEK